jgi:hypothetical protein
MVANACAVGVGFVWPDFIDDLGAGDITHWVGCHGSRLD